MGWSSVGVTNASQDFPVPEGWYQILPAYAQDGIMLSQIFCGLTDASLFADFIEQLLQHCGQWPKPKAVLIMDNASFHHTE